MRRWLLLSLLSGLLLASTLDAQVPRAQTPRLDLEPTAQCSDCRWLLSDLPLLLDDDEVRQHLDTGLTTSFVVRLSWRDATGQKHEGGARAQIRYELWDELYEVAVLGLDGRLHQAQLRSFDALVTWWSGLRLVVLNSSSSLLGSRATRPRATAKVTVDVVPFSRAEQQDAQRWFSDSLEKAGRGNTEEVARSVNEQPEKLSKVLGLLMATSIQRRAIVTYRWNLKPPSEGQR